MNHTIEGMLGVSMEKIREMVDVNTIIGTPITTPDGLTTVIPVSRVSFGFGSGGSDLPSKTEKDIFGGGAGAGVSIRPLAFLIISGTDVDLIQIDEHSKGLEKAVEIVPEAISKLMNMFKKKKDDKKNAKDEDIQIKDK